MPCQDIPFSNGISEITGIVCGCLDKYEWNV